MSLLTEDADTSPEILTIPGEFERSHQASLRSAAWIASLHSFGASQQGLFVTLETVGGAVKPHPAVGLASGDDSDREELGIWMETAGRVIPSRMVTGGTSTVALSGPWRSSFQLWFPLTHALPRDGGRVVARIPDSSDLLRVPVDPDDYARAVSRSTTFG